MTRALVIFALLMPLSASAAGIEIMSYESDGGTRLEVYLSATAIPINAIEATLTIDGRLRDLRSGGSVVSHWVDAPKIEGNTIHFSGVMPGGFTGAASAGAGLSGPGRLFSLVVEGVGHVSLSNAALYLHDGNGTRLALKDGQLPILQTQATVETPDRTPPEYVDIVPFFDDLTTQGVHALLIDAYDGESGIDRLEVREGNGEWQRVDAMYLVQDTHGFSRITVRAYDRAGNFLERTIPGRNEIWRNIGYALAVSVIGLGVLFWTVYWRKRRP